TVRRMYVILPPKSAGRNRLAYGLDRNAVATGHPQSQAREVTRDASVLLGLYPKTMMGDFSHPSGRSLYVRVRHAVSGRSTVVPATVHRVHGTLRHSARNLRILAAIVSDRAPRSPC